MQRVCDTSAGPRALGLQVRAVQPRHPPGVITQTSRVARGPVLGKGSSLADPRSAHLASDLQRCARPRLSLGISPVLRPRPSSRSHLSSAQLPGTPLERVSPAGVRPSLLKFQGTSDPLASVPGLPPRFTPVSGQTPSLDGRWERKCSVRPRTPPATRGVWPSLWASLELPSLYDDQALQSWTFLPSGAFLGQGGLQQPLFSFPGGTLPAQSDDQLPTPSQSRLLISWGPALGNTLKTY